MRGTRRFHRAPSVVAHHAFRLTRPKTPSLPTPNDMPQTDGSPPHTSSTECKLAPVRRFHNWGSSASTIGSRLDGDAYSKGRSSSYSSRRIRHRRGADSGAETQDFWCRSWCRRLRRSTVELAANCRELPPRRGTRRARKLAGIHGQGAQQRPVSSGKQAVLNQ